MTRPPRQTDLFGAAPRGDRDTTPVSIRMAVIDETPLALFLAIEGRKGTAKWAPKAHLRAGEGRDENLFTMPRWVAKERSWL